MNPSITTNSEELAIRVDESNINHHLWNNNGTWWLHYTVYPTPVTSVRRRRSLKTQNIKRARLIRDEIFNALAAGILPLAA
jgi:hypothetical protein